MSISKDVDEKIYVHNAFRLFNLPITSKQGKINTAYRRIESKVQLKGLSPRESISYSGKVAFPITPNPNFNDYQNAMNRASKSDTRFIDEVFWFWPENLDNSDDPTLKSLENCEALEAHRIWKSSNAPNASHNIAVYNHLTAIDQEITNNNLNNRKTWEESLKYWHITLSSNDFKNLAIERIRQINDPTLKESFIDEIYNELPVTLLSINANFAKQYFNNRDKDNFQKHMSLIKESDFNESAKKEALKNILNTLYSSVSNKFENFKKEDYDSTSIPKIESFIDEIEDNIIILKDNFSDRLEIKLLCNDIASTIRLKIVIIERNSFTGINYERAKIYLGKLKDMAFDDNIKNEIQESINEFTFKSGSGSQHSQQQPTQPSSDSGGGDGINDLAKQIERERDRQPAKTGNSNNIIAIVIIVFIILVILYLIFNI